MRLFVAVDIDDETRAQLVSVRAAIRAVLDTARVPPRVTWVNEAQAHVTVRFIGEQDEQQGAAIREALEGDFAIAPFDVCWDRIGSFGGRGRRVIWIGASAGAESLATLADHVNRRLEPLIGPADPRPFNAHVTLGRVKDGGKDVDWPRALDSAALRPTSTRVGHVTLCVSRLSSEGPTYTALCRARLT